VKADRNVKKFGGGHILRRICGSQNSAANSARRNFSVGFSADKIFCSEFGGGWGSNQASVAVASAAAAAATTGACGRVCIVDGRVLTMSVQSQRVIGVEHLLPHLIAKS